MDALKHHIAKAVYESIDEERLLAGLEEDRIVTLTVSQVTPLISQIRIARETGGPRYFNVQVSESV